MKKAKKELGLDQNGVQKMMHTKDYLSDMTGQIGINLVVQIIGQLTYFYTDKVGLAAMGVGVIMVISKVIDAITDLWFGNIIDHSKGGSRKYYRWVCRLMVPYAIVVALLFCVPIQAGQIPALIYACVTNILLSSICGTLIGTSLSAVMVVRTNSSSERESMGIFRAVGSYGAGMFISIVTIPLTNFMGGNQSAWIKYGFIMALIILLMLSICYMNGRKAKLADMVGNDGEVIEFSEEEQPLPLKESIPMLFKNKYWLILILFNLITQVTNSITATSGTYYCKWIFGNDNLVALAGAFGMIATLIGFILSKPVIAKFGIRKTIDLGVLGAALTAAVRCIIPTNLPIYIGASLVGSFVQIPLMCLYGVLLAMVVDYNDYKYHHKLVGITSGAIGIGQKIGSGLGSIILTGCLTLGAYDATLEIATTSMRYAIYAFSNYLPLIINLILFFLFKSFDLEEKLPTIRKELARRQLEKETESK